MTREDRIQARLSIDAKQAINELGDLGQKTTSLALKNKALRDELKKAERQFGENSVQARQLKSQIAANSEAITANNARMTELRQQYGAVALTGRQLSKAYADTKRELQDLTVGTQQYSTALDRLHDIEKERSARRGIQAATLQGDTAMMGGLKQQLSQQFSKQALLGGLAGGLVGGGVAGGSTPAHAPQRHDRIADGLGRGSASGLSRYARRHRRRGTVGHDRHARCGDPAGPCLHVPLR